MKLRESLCAAKRSAMNWMALGLLMAVTVMTSAAGAQGVSTTTVQGTVYLASGQPASGTLVIKWPSFTTVGGQAVAADTLLVTIAADGFVNVNLAPNQGSTPAGEYYTAVYYLSDGTTSTEYWVVPAVASVTLGQVRAQVMPAAQAVQVVSKTYVDQSFAQLSESMITASGGNLNGPLYLSADPTQALQAADKHYVDAMASAAGQNSLPVTGGTLSGPLTGTSANFAITNSSANGMVNVMAAPYSAKGDCSKDDHDAIQAALDHVLSVGSGATVFFPAAPGGCYLTSTLNYRGQSMKGQVPRGVNPRTWSAGTVIQGEPGQDILHVADPTASSLQVWPSWTIEDITFENDSSVDASANFPHRWPGRWAADGAITSGTNQLTSVSSEFSCGDAGQPIRVVGAGTNGGNLDTTIVSVPNCWLYGMSNTVTLAANATITVTAANVYTSLMSIPVTQTVGNCAIAADEYDGNTAHWKYANASFNNTMMRNVTFESNSGSINNSCGMYLAGTYEPYAGQFQNVDIVQEEFGIVESMSDTNVAMGNSGQDYQNFEQGTWGAIYPFIGYDLSLGKFIDLQIEGAGTNGNGPEILEVAQVSRSDASNDYIRSPEEELGTGVGWRLHGEEFIGDQVALCSSNTSHLDTAYSVFRASTCYGTLDISGRQNYIDLSGGDMAGVTVNDQGAGNTVTYSRASNPFAGTQKTIPQMLSKSRGANYVTGFVSGEFAQNGNAATPYPNIHDLFVMPEDIVADGGYGGPLVYGTDTNSFTGRYVLPATNGGLLGEFATFNHYAVIGTHIPAGPVELSMGFMCPTSGTGYTLKVYANYATIATSSSFTCNNAYTTQTLQADLSSYSGQNLGFSIGTSGTYSPVHIGWVNFKPFPATWPLQSIQVGLTGTPMSGNHGTGASVQHSDGTGASGDVAKYALDGSVTDGPALPASAIVGTADSQTLTNKTIDGVSPTSFAYLDATSSIQLQMNGKVSGATTVNGHALSTNVVVSASDLTTGTLPHAQLPALVSGDIPANAANTSGTAAGLSGNPAITPSSVTATGLVTGANDTTRTSSTTMTNSWTSTGLALPVVPANTTKSGRCAIYWQMSSTSYTASFGLGMSNAPTNVWGGSSVTYAATGTTSWLAFTQSATTTTAISTAATAGATGTTYRAEIDFTIQTGASNPVAMIIYGQTSNSGGTLSIMPGSTCYWLP